ncbi:MAG TPA: class I SAM-dependent methyltransferase [Thermoanaerobaculia bacterium]|nr:class I SAM-dependent methyltransferase [Thermoanaerobaculia bacterium]
MKASTAGEAYGAFAYAYDQSLGERFFKAVRATLEQVLAKYPTAKRTHLDVACGTGLALRWFRERGWMSVGIDASLPMLRLARTRAPQVIAADLRALPLRRRFARITCLYDSLNHLLDRNELVAAFRAMRGVMDHDSLLLFDMNHPDIYPAIWGIADPFIADGPDFHLEMATSYRAREKIAKAMVTGWAKIGGERIAIREQHRQRAYSEREIVSSLAEAQLTPVDVIDFDPYHDQEWVESDRVKMFFVCRPERNADFQSAFHGGAKIGGERVAILGRRCSSWRPPVPSPRVRGEGQGEGRLIRPFASLRATFSPRGGEKGLRARTTAPARPS